MHAVNPVWAQTSAPHALGVQSVAVDVVALPVPVGVLVPQVTVPLRVTVSSRLVRWEPPKPQHVRPADASMVSCVHWGPPVAIVSGPHVHDPEAAHPLQVHAFAPTVAETSAVFVKPAGQKDCVPNATGVHPEGTVCVKHAGAPQSGTSGKTSFGASRGAASDASAPGATSDKTSTAEASAQLAPQVR